MVNADNGGWWLPQVLNTLGQNVQLACHVVAFSLRRQRRTSASFLGKTRRRKADPEGNALLTNLRLSTFRPFPHHHRRFSTVSHCQVSADSLCNALTRLITKHWGHPPQSPTNWSWLKSRLQGFKQVAWWGTDFLNTCRCRWGAKRAMKSLKVINPELAA